ncbi:MAG: hypothetical protein A2Y24_06035 [Clostridiales bacterium GWE2_32_10]|nr:MAG: hypothetical protein A2Y24_06035 [Clostridiales bacterium GWE2_32_10]HBY20727.1 Xaa-Pro dipeptidase [Clostridiales bacterium]
MDKEFFINNRQKLIKSLPENCTLVLFSGNSKFWSGDQKYKFSINKNFYYAMGLEEENYVYVYQKADRPVEIMFIEKDNDEKYIKLSGHKKSKAHVYNVTSIQDIRYTDEFYVFIKSIDFSVTSTFYIDMIDLDCIFTNELMLSLNLWSDNITYYDVNIEFSKLRAIKQTCELEKIKEAIKITGKGIMNILANAKKCRYENEIEALYDYEIKMAGIFEKAFNSDVSSGKNATILHYNKNNSKINENDLLLVDLGVRYENYCSDISRTFPKSGHFSDRQKLLYNIVLTTQIETMNSIQIGMTFKELNEVTRQSFIRQLKEINLIEKDEEIEKYYYHSVSHSLGLDAHDNRKYIDRLQQGMVITIEPGLYIEEEGIGIRIEDDILITADGYVDLSRDIPKEIGDIEDIMARVEINRGRGLHGGY